MTRRGGAILVLAAAMVVGLGYAAYWWGMRKGMAAPSTAAAGAPADSSERKVLYWHDPMVPGHKFDKPGKSPFMDMQLVPVYAGDADGSGVSVSSRMQQNLGVRIAEATKVELAPAIEAVGTVAYNERDVALVQARANGFIEKLHVRATLDAVRRGQPLADLYAPDWVAAQEEYLALDRMSDPGLRSLREAAAQRMRLAGMTDEQVRRVVTTGQVHPRITLTSPIDGVVSDLAAREGQSVMTGAPLFRINGLGTIWVNAEISENVAAQVRPGTQVEARAAAFPGKSFKGRVSAILPEVNTATRTLKARVELANPGGGLVPGMFATLHFAPSTPRAVVTIPTEAVIQTGKRTVVVLANTAPDGKQLFTPVDVEVGAEAAGLTEIRKGIEAGAKVVVSGQFLIDSESSLKATETRFADATAAQPKTHTGVGKVEAVATGSVTLSHGPITSMQWGAMTMDFLVPKDGATNLAPGTTVEFDFTATPDGQYQITAVRPKALADTRKSAP